MMKVGRLSSILRYGLLTFRALFWSSITLTILSVILLFTAPGNHLVVATLNAFVPNLTIKMADKPLLRGGRFSLNYQNDALKLELQDSALDVRFYSCATVCIDYVESGGVAISLFETEPASEIPSSTPAILAPFPIAIKRIKLARFDFQQANLAVSITDITSQLMWQETLFQVAQLDVDTLTIKVDDSARQTTATQQQIPLSLPEISPIHFTTPLNWQLEKLAINKLDFKAGEKSEQLKGVQLSAKQQGNHLSLSQLSLRYQDILASTQADIRFAGSTPLNLQLLLETPSDKLNATISGDFEKLQASAILSGRYQGSLSLDSGLTQRNLPFNALLTVPNLAIEQQENKYSISQTELTLNGDLTGYKYQLISHVTANSLASITLDTHGAGDFTSLNIDKLVVSSEQSALELAGQANWQQGVTLDLSVLSDGLVIEEFYPAVSSELALKGQITFTQTGQNWQLTIPEFNLVGDINNAPLEAAFAFNLNDQLNADIHGFELTSGDSALTLQGKLAKEWALEGALTLVNPEQLDSRLSGRGNASFQVLGERNQPKINWQVALSELGFEQYQIAQINSEGLLNIANDYEADIALELSELRFNNTEIDSLSVKGMGNLLGHQLSLTMTSEQINIDGQISAGLNGQQYHANVEKLSLKNQLVNLAAEESIALNYALDTQTLNINQHCWRGSNSQFCFDEASLAQQQGQVGLDLQQFDLAMLGFVLPKSIQASGNINGKVMANWQAGKLEQLHSTINSDSVNFTIDESFIRTQIPIETFSLLLNADDQRLALDGEISSSVLGNVIADIDLADLQNTRQLSGNILLEALQLSNLQGFSQRIDNLAGTINGKLMLAGSSYAPLVNGEIKLEELVFDAPWSPLTISKGDAALLFDDLNAQLDVTIEDAKQGNIALTGHANWQQSPKLSAKVKGDKFRIALQPSLWVAVSPEIELTVADKFVQLSGLVKVVDGRIKVKELPEGAVSISDDEIILDGPEVKKGIPFNYGLDLAIVIDEKVRIDSFGVKAKLKGDLLFKQESNSPLMATGDIALIEGGYRALGQELLIENGQLNFNGALDKPYLNVRAIRNPDLTDDGVTAGVKLTGAIDAPVLEVFSDPSMDQAVALSYLLTGRALGETDSATDGMLTQLLLARGLARGESSVSKIGEVIGIEDVSLSSRGSGDETKVEISGYVAPGIQVRYSIGIFDSMSEVAVRYQLLPRLYIEAISGLNDSLDVLYKFDWD